MWICSIVLWVKTSQNISVSIETWSSWKMLKFEGREKRGQIKLVGGSPSRVGGGLSLTLNPTLFMWIIIWWYISDYFCWINHTEGMVSEYVCFWWKEKLSLTRTRILTETDDLNNESLAVDCVLADLDCVLTIPDLPSPKFLPALDEDFSSPGPDPNIVSPSYNRILTQQEMDISPFNRSTVGK